MNSKILELTVMETGRALATKLSVIYCFNIITTIGGMWN